MTFVVPFDGSELAETALVRAVEFSEVFDGERVLALSVVPQENPQYARERGWLDSGEEFDLESVVATLHDRVTDLCPSADFRHRVVDRYATPGTVSNRIRDEARGEDASMVFVGSENAGKIVTSVSSVGGSVAADESYDVVIVRHRRPSRIRRLRDESPHRQPKSDFYPRE